MCPLFQPFEPPHQHQQLQHRGLTLWKSHSPSQSPSERHNPCRLLCAGGQKLEKNARHMQQSSCTLWRFVGLVICASGEKNAIHICYFFGAESYAGEGITGTACKHILWAFWLETISASFGDTTPIWICWSVRVLSQLAAFQRCTNEVPRNAV